VNASEKLKPVGTLNETLIWQALPDFPGVFDVESSLTPIKSVYTSDFLGASNVEFSAQIKSVYTNDLEVGSM
jgi:hypothetical protein